MSVPSALVIENKISHYEAVETALWHVQMQMTEVTDIAFAGTLLLDLSTVGSQTNWFYRKDEFGEDGELSPFPSGGVETHGSLSRGDDRWVATAFYRLTAGQLYALVKDKPYLVRTRQSADGGVMWGDYLARIIYA